MSSLQRENILDYFKYGGTRHEFYDCFELGMNPSILHYFNINLLEIKINSFNCLMNEFNLFNLCVFIDDFYDLLDSNDYKKIQSIIDTIDFYKLDAKNKGYYLNVLLCTSCFNFTGLINYFFSNNDVNSYNRYLNLYKQYSNNLSDIRFITRISDYEKGYFGNTKINNYITLEESFFKHKFEDSFWDVKEYSQLKVFEKKFFDKLNFEKQRYIKSIASYRYPY